MPPDVTMTACALSENVPTGGASSARRAPLARLQDFARTPSIAPPSGQRGDAVAETQRDQPGFSASRTRRMNGAITPGPVPQVMWKRGTELPWPVAS